MSRPWRIWWKRDSLGLSVSPTSASLRQRTSRRQPRQCQQSIRWSAIPTYSSQSFSNTARAKVQFVSKAAPPLTLMLLCSLLLPSSFVSFLLSFHNYFSPGIMLEAYSPLENPANPFKGKDTPTILENPTIKEIAQKHGAIVGQVHI